MENDLITAESIEATEFLDLSRQYRVMAVPRTVINDKVAIEGALPEAMFIDRILEAAQKSA